MHAHRSASRERRAQGTTAFALAVAVVVALAVPAWAHAEFPTAPSFGYQPNTAGGTGELGSTPPYAPNSTPTLYLRVPFEQTVPYHGADDTTVDVKVYVPAGWTNPACGAARTLVNNASTKNTDQPGATVAHWTCDVLTVNGQPVLHWSGPQVVPPQTANNSAQFFVFKVTTPAPAVHTTYDGTHGTSGFIVDQIYASGHTQHWIPSPGYRGTPPAGSTTEVSDELARTVGAGPNCTTAAGTISFNPALPKLSSSNNVKTRITATGTLSGCSGAGVTSGHLTFTSTNTNVGNCKTLLTYKSTTSTTGTETITWNTGKTSTIKVTLGQVHGNSQQTSITGTITAGLFTTSHQTGTLVFTLPSSACTKTGLNAASYKQAGPIQIR